MAFRFILICGVLLIAAIIYLPFSENSIQNTDAILEKTAKQLDNLPVPTNNASLESPASESEKITYTYTYSDNNAELKYRHYLAGKYTYERGLISPEDREIYQNYPLAVLRGLGDAGDIHALQELGQRASKAGNFKLAFDYYEAATIYGSTTALAYLRDKYELANRLYLDKSNGKHALVMIFSYLRVAELRGDYSDSMGVDRLAEMHERTYGKTELDEIDYRVIERMAAAIYTGMETRRTELGLEPFDNTVPEYDVEQMERVLKARAQKGFGL